jgi:myosin heavy subunit
MAAAAIAAAASQKDMGWYKTGSVKKKPALTDPVQLYSLCEVVSSEGSGPEAVLTVKVVDPYYDNPVDYLPQGGGVKKGETLTVTRENFHAANPPEQDMCMDLGELDNMHEPGLLHCMGMRYCGGSKTESQVTSYYCTFIGPICVATNPFAPQKAWKNSFNRDDYVHSKGPVMQNKKLQPHPWAIGDMSYNELLTEGNNQAILICGESGAGKTECCKFVLDFLVQKKESLVENLTDKLLATNDPLEAFGNAKTVNNDNSSRFAKCMQIALDREGRVCGAEIQTSLLEKARSCAFFVQERNFHIFYMLPYYRHVKCQPDPGEKQQTDTSDALDMLGEKAHKYLMEADKYSNLKQGDVIHDSEGVRYRERFQANDIDWYKRVISSFRVSLGYTKKDTDEMIALLVGCLHLGQLEFKDDDTSEILPESDGDVAVIVRFSHPLLPSILPR